MSLSYYSWDEHYLLVSVTLNAATANHIFLLDNVSQEEFFERAIAMMGSNFFTISSVQPIGVEVFDLLAETFEKKKRLISGE